MKKEIEAVPGVTQTFWLSDVIDPSIPTAMLPADVQQFMFGKNDSTMLIVRFDAPSASDETMEAVAQIEKLLRKDCFFGGMSVILQDTKALVNQEMPLYILCLLYTSTIAISLDGNVEYALEGSVFVGGAVIQWIRDGMHLIQDSCDSEYYAQKVPDNGGVYIVPAFTGLGAPYWDMYARGAILGITRGTTQNHIIRAAEESIAYQSADLMWAMEKDTDITISTLKVDGGASRDHFLMQFQSDILNKEVLRPAIRETTALGADVYKRQP